jgi:hypothetical protein
MTIIIILAALFLVPYLYTKLASPNPEDAAVNGLGSLIVGIGCVVNLIVAALPVLAGLFLLSLIF